MSKLIQKQLLTGILFCSISAFSQEMVPNNSFENYTALPDSWSQWDRCSDWTNAGGEPVDVFYAGPDYFHLEGSGPVELPSVPPATVNPHTGSAIMGFLGYHDPSVGVENIREYISVELSEPMVPGNSYEISFWITSGESGIGHYYKCDGIGILLTTEAPDQEGTGYIDAEPQAKIEGEFFSNEWEEFTFEVEADLAYTHMTLGNFVSDEEISVSVAVEGPLPFAGAYYFVDDFSVELSEVNSLIDEEVQSPITLYPNPATNQVKLALPTENKELANYKIYNDIGELIINNSFKTTTTINLEELAKGIYVIQVKQGESIWNERLVVE